MMYWGTPYLVRRPLTRVTQSVSACYLPFPLLAVHALHLALASSCTAQGSFSPLSPAVACLQRPQSDNFSSLVIFWIPGSFPESLMALAAFWKADIRYVDEIQISTQQNSIQRGGSIEVINTPSQEQPDMQTSLSLLPFQAILYLSPTISSFYLPLIYSLSQPNLTVVGIQSWIKMVDCDYFTDFNKDLTIEQDRILLEFKKSNYSLELGFPFTGCKKVQRSTGNLNFKKKVQIKAVYGIIEMEVNSYLVVVTKASLIGQIFGRKIFQVQKMEYFCLASEESPKDKKYVEGLDWLFSNKFWYFSDEYDLTNSLQQFVSNGYSLKNKRLEYMYNADWIDEFLKLKAYEWITGFISGFINIGFTHVGASTYDIALVTRRDRRRQGKRWVMRGADLDGNTVNTAETETVIQTEFNSRRHIYSHVQLRGSMPFLWSQTPDLKWSPTVTISQNDRLNCQVMRKNYDDILKNYQNCAFLNLIDKKGSQKRLGDYFERTHRSIDYSNMLLIWFDFHAECKNMKYENISILLDKVSHELENYGYFYIETSKEKETIAERSERPIKRNVQKGIFRTNCMDCLDRTNVVQSVIARQLMLSWMSKVGVITKGRSTSAFERLPDNLEEIFRMQWTANANAMSLFYSGTPAQKTDFTATGKRTSKGGLKDAHSGIKRYFLGNFYDTRQQDMIDFSLAKIKPKQNPSERISPSGMNSMWVLLFVVVLLVIQMIIAFFVTAELIDRSMPGSSLGLPVKMFGGLASAGLVLFMARKMKKVVLRGPIRNEELSKL